MLSSPADSTTLLPVRRALPPASARHPACHSFRARTTRVQFAFAPPRALRVRCIFAQSGNGSSRELHHPLMANFYNLFLKAAERWPNQIAVELQQQSGAGERHSYGELRRQAESLARGLQARYSPGTSLAILAANGPRWVAAYLGILASGC